MMQRWYRLLLGIVVSQVAWLATFWAAPSPLYAVVLIVGMLGSVAILCVPQVGVFLLSALLIGQWPWNIISYLGLLTVASAAAWLLIHQMRLFPRNIILMITGCYLLLGIASVISPKTSVDVKSQVIMLAGHCAFVWLFVTLMRERRMVIIAVRLMVFSGIVTALIGLVQSRTHFVWITSTTRYFLELNEKAYERGTTAFDLQQWRGQFRVDSITGTPDFLPLYMQSLMPFVGFWVVRQRLWSLRLVGIGVLALFGLVHLLSYTRGALFTTAAVLFLLVWTIDRKRLMIYGPMIALVFFTAIMSWEPWRDRLLTMVRLKSVEAANNENTGSWRLRTIPVAIQMIAERPLLGVGLGQQRWNWPASTYGDLVPDPKLFDPLPIHNDYLKVPIELGLGGLTLILLLIITTIGTLHRLVRDYTNSGDIELADLSRGTMLAIVGIALAMTMYPMIDNFRYFWLLLGVAAALLRIQDERQTSVPSLQRR